MPPGPDTVIGVEGGELLGHGRVDFGLRVGGIGRPVALRNELSGELGAIPVAEAWVAELTAAVGLWHRLQIGIAQPATISQTGDRLRGVVDERPLAHRAGGDVRLHLKWLAVGRPLGHGRVTVALAPFVAMPTGDREEFGGVGGVWGEARVAAGWHSPGCFVAAHVGLRFRPQTVFFGRPERWAIVIAGAVEREMPMSWLDHRVSVMVVVDGESWRDGGPAPIEARGGARVRIWRGISAALAFGGGLAAELGAPSWRALLEMRVEPGS
jgi:hypothetical protein